ncbi:MAG: GTP-binding protein LepA [Candidatus Parcubacteria bacterium]|jgi:GTP-binding protein LepA|nr:GTP-binding protein LepA [Candidatus Parcubacteria bacterium]
MDPRYIRNFSIIAHIDHGKSTLADRLLEMTGTIEKRKMQEQVLDSMELERERGITIKMQPVRMKYREYILNLIDTPGHIDFSYEVSRALRAVEGSILLVDATQGVQAQTLTTLNMARAAGLTILPVVSKIDSPLARTDEVSAEVCQLLGCSKEDVLKVSGKTGEGVARLLEEIVRRIPAPFSSAAEAAEGAKAAGTAAAGPVKAFRSLIFDFHYSNHTGVIVYVRVFDGAVGKHDRLSFKVARKEFEAIEVGIFAPDHTPAETLSAGEIGYIVTGIKEPGVASVGDTVSSVRDQSPPLPGYETPRPVVWASLYPESQDDLSLLRQALGRLKLSDSAFTYEEEASGTLGKGYRAGFLGMLHLEIVTERLRREFNLELIVTMPTITYVVKQKDGKTVMIYSPALFPDDHDIALVSEPIVTLKILTPPRYIGGLMRSLYDHEAEVLSTETFGDNRTMLVSKMPLRELMRNFFDELKSVSSGYASVSYDIGEDRPADVTRLDILIADEIVPAFSRVVGRKRVNEEATSAVERLYKNLPRELFSFKIQAKALGRIIASRTLSGMKKDVAGTLSGGDITRKMKLREKQKKGKKRLKARGRVTIPQEIFVKMMRGGGE